MLLFLMVLFSPLADARGLAMSERQPGALHGGSPFEPTGHGPSSIGPGPGPPTLLAQDGWIVSGGPPPPYLIQHGPQDFVQHGPSFGPGTFDPVGQFNKMALPPSFPFPAPGFAFPAKEPEEPANGSKEEGLSARLLDKTSSSDGSPRAGTPAGNVGYRPWEQEGYEGTRPPSAPPKDRSFSNGGADKGGVSPGMQCMVESASASLSGLFSRSE